MEQHEVLVYHHLYNKNFGEVEISMPADITYAPKTKGSSYTRVVHSISKIMAVLGLMALILAFSPTVFSYFDYLGSTAQEAVPAITGEVKKVDDYMPVFDPTLPMEGRLIISSVGINTDINEATLANHEDALRRGVWRVSDFGDPGARSMPTIMAAHRFGYLAWTNSYRKLNSFYNLPKAKIGDTIEIDWQGRRYMYEIYGTQKGENITDYSADLILYTCESLAGSEKDFVYARLLRI